MTKNSVVNNLGRNLISQLIVKWGTENILNVNNYHLYSTFKDLWLTEEERDDMVFQGIQHKNLTKLGSGVTEANVVGETAAQKMLKTVYGEKYKIPIDFDLLSTPAPFYKFNIHEDIIFEITLASKKYIIFTETTANMDYKLKNICLEYDTVTNETIANQLQSNYNAGFSIFYDWVDCFKVVNIAANDTLVNEGLNVPKRSIKGILLLFISDYADGKRDSEKFENPKLTNVKITIEGISNKIFPEGMRMLDHWPEIKKHFLSEDLKKTHDCHMNIEKYYSGNHYAFWLDLRTTEDNTLHGPGRPLQNTKDGIQLSITKETGEGPYKMHIFMISDAQVNIQNSQIASLMF